MKSVSVIVIGGCHHNTLGVVRSLGRKGLKPVVVLTNTGSCSVLESRYISKGGAANGSDEAISLLEREFANQDDTPVVIACHDEISSKLDQNRDRLSTHLILPGCKQQGRVTEIQNKQSMATLALKVGMRVPYTAVYSDTTQLSIGSIPMPCITKQLVSKDGTKSDIRICSTVNELKKFLEYEAGREFMVQQFIDKDIEFQLIGCSLNDGNEIIIPGVSIIIRQPSNTNTGFLHYTNLDSSFNETIEATKRFMREVGYSGLFSAEFLRGKDGVDYFMEVNFRNDGNSIAVTNAGVNLPYIWYLGSTGQDYQSELQPIHDEYVMPEFAELELFREGVITRKQWKDDMQRATSYMDYAPDDPAPTEGWRRYRRAKRFAYIRHIINTFKNKK